MPSVTRPLDLSDAQALTGLYTENRAFLAPWKPLRSDSYFTETGQREAVEAILAQKASGSAVPLVIWTAAARLREPSPSPRSFAERSSRAASATGSLSARKVMASPPRRYGRLPN